MRREGPSVMAGGVLLVCLSLAACVAPREEPAAETVAADSTPPEAALAPEEAFDENPIAQLPGEGEPREFNLLIVNRLDADAYVFASAGAARVVLDTVSRSDSVYVDIRLRSDQVRLEAEDGSGRVISSVEIDLVPTQVNRWEMTALRSDRIALEPKRDPLVTSADEDYPRSQ